jgi:hypothetical protein
MARQPLFFLPHTRISEQLLKLLQENPNPFVLKLIG